MQLWHFARGKIDKGAQAAAINWLLRDYLGTSDPEACGVLAPVVNDQAASTRIRFLAYIGLFEVCTRPLGKYPSIDVFYRDPTSVDWDLVKMWS